MAIKQIKTNGTAKGGSNGITNGGSNGASTGASNGSAASVPMSGATKLRQKLFETDDLIVCPGVYDGLSARIALDLGFEAMYMVRYPIPFHINC